MDIQTLVGWWWNREHSCEVSQWRRTCWHQQPERRKWLNLKWRYIFWPVENDEAFGEVFSERMKMMKLVEKYFLTGWSPAPVSKSKSIPSAPYCFHWATCWTKSQICKYLKWQPVKPSPPLPPCSQAKSKGWDWDCTHTCLKIRLFLWLSSSVVLIH